MSRRIDWVCPHCHNRHWRIVGPEHHIVKCYIEYCVVPLSKSTKLERPYLVVLRPTDCLVCSDCDERNFGPQRIPRITAQHVEEVA